MPPGVVVDLRSTSAVPVFVFTTHGDCVMRNPYPFHTVMSAARREQLLRLRLGDHAYFSMQFRMRYEWRLEA